jgi:hypothetical protein
MSRVRCIRTRHPDTKPYSNQTLPKRSRKPWLASLQSLCAGTVTQLVTTGLQGWQLRQLLQIGRRWHSTWQWQSIAVLAPVATQVGRGAQVNTNINLK